MKEVKTDKNKLGKRLLGIAGGLVLYYFLTGHHPNVPDREKYPLPQEIKVIQANYTNKTGEEISIGGKNLRFHEARKQLNLEERAINTDDIDFSKDMQLTTKRYNFARDKDYMVSRAIGWLVSLPRRLILFDYDISNGLNAEKTKSVLAKLENDTTLKNLTVRVNHNEPLYDTKRLFRDDMVKARNGGAARVLFGVGSTLGAELFSELSRGDYYNPMTQSVCVYSNVESVAFHEMGHYRDCHRYDRDWVYGIFRAFPPVTLYQEARASLFAKKDLAEPDKNQFARYLIPAFATYLLWAAGKVKKAAKKIKDEDKEEDKED